MLVAVRVLLWRREQRLAVFVAVTATTGSLLNTAVKMLVNRARPALSGCLLGGAPGQSFPSGHAMNTTIVYGAIVLAFLSLVPGGWRRLLVGIYTTWVLTMAWSRMTLGVHYLSDVFGGIVLGCAWLALGAAVFQAWRKEAGQRPADALREGLDPHDEHAAEG